MFNTLAIILHLVAINVWVGGMFFVVIVLGKVMESVHEPEQQALWSRILARFFFWVWLALITLLITGSGMIAYRYGGVAGTPTYILIMAGLGLLMAGIFFAIYFVYYQRFKQAIQRNDIPATHYALRMIRRLGIANIVIGLCVVIVIGSGRFLVTLF
jgi:uncharacterized membrane protein